MTITIRLIRTRSFSETNAIGYIVATCKADDDPPPVFVNAPLVGRAYGWALRAAIQDDTWS